MKKTKTKITTENGKIKRKIILNGFRGEVEIGKDEKEYKTVLHTPCAINPGSPNFKTIDVEIFFELDDQGIFQLENTKLKEVQPS